MSLRLNLQQQDEKRGPGLRAAETDEQHSGDSLRVDHQVTK